jgi:hypothetical protein
MNPIILKHAGYEKKGILNIKTNSTLLERYSLPAFINLTPPINNAIALFLPVPQRVLPC